YKELNKIKKNKNELLKKGKKKELKVWNRLLAEVIPVITRDRKNIVLQINEFISQIFLELTGSQRNLMLVYSDDLEGKAVSEKDELIDFFDNKADHEIAKGFSFYGPHKDRYWMTLDGKLDKENFSQGEYRISFLALQFSINRVLKKKIDYQPVLLMDDLFSELDENVYQKTLNYIYENQNQVFITSTLKPNISSFYGQAFHINDGQLI
ncbi:MAG: hypothetical protein OEY59_10780, partial [Deltaproteobacteria bacterium]|nr:hypothetical protein [Deltaproteobacteria bacterium]